MGISQSTNQDKANAQKKISSCRYGGSRTKGQQRYTRHGTFHQFALLGEDIALEM